MAGVMITSEGVCEDCGLSLSLAWRAPKEVRRASLDLIEQWDYMELEATDVPATGSLRLTGDGWVYTGLCPEEAVYAENMRVNEWEVNRRTMCYRELMSALLGHARAWLCHGGIDRKGRRLVSGQCWALEPTYLNREWDRLFSSSSSGYRTVTWQQMRNLIHDVDAVVPQDGDWVRDDPVEVYVQREPWLARWQSKLERDARYQSLLDERYGEDMV